mmetsp:Transcript_12985/g.11080  ORF Transcript_12985/g.11080 Transcript_12985/m.11080 type:complete len:92 (-) Transcript_12985:119-394(-)
MSYQAALAALQQAQQPSKQQQPSDSSNDESGNDATTFHRLTEEELDKLVYAQKNDDIDIYDPPRIFIPPQLVPSRYSIRSPRDRLDSMLQC